MKRSVLIFFICITSFLQAQDLPEPMRPKRIVNDFTQLFSPQQQQALEQKLRYFNDTSSTQIAIVTVPTLQGYAPSDYAQRLAEKWGVGQKGKDNGVLLLIKPKSRTEKGQVAIAVGYGLEGVIPDAIASRIIRNEIIPEFQQNNYYRGINRATDVLMQLAGGEFTAEQYARKNGNGSAEVIIIPILILFLLPLFFRRKKGYTTGSHGSGGIPPIFFGGFGGGSSNFGSFSGGSGSFGVLAVAGPVEAGKTINTDNANTGQYHMFTPQSRRGERHGIFVYQILQAFGIMGGFFPEQYSPVGRSGTGLFYPFMGKKNPNLPTSNHL